MSREAATELSPGARLRETCVVIVSKPMNRTKLPTRKYSFEYDVEMSELFSVAASRLI